MTYVSVELRRLVIERAKGCCEYCRISQEDSDSTFHVEHIIAVSHGGKTIAENLALSCIRCNLFKGSNIAAADPATDEPTFLFHPCRHLWEDHFRIAGTVFEPLSPEGRATVFILRLNDPDRVDEREVLIELNRYPCKP